MSFPDPLAPAREWLKADGPAWYNAVKGAAGATLKGIQMFKFVSSMNEAFGVVDLMADPALRAEVIRASSELRRRLLRIPFSEFKAGWAFARQLVGLQGRLLLEQNFFVLGSPWADLVTGFKPIQFGSGAAAAEQQTTSTTTRQVPSVPTTYSKRSFPGRGETQ